MTWLLPACGMKGPPRAPTIILPNRVADVQAERFGDQVYLQFTVPTGNSDGSQPADLERIEIYALTTNPDDDPSTPVPLEDWTDAATLVATVPVLDPALPATAGVEAVAPDGAPDPDRSRDSDEQRPRRVDAQVQGETVTLVEELTAESFVPVMFEDEDEGDDEEELEAEPVGPLVSPALPATPRRTYLLQGVSSRGRESAASERVEVSLAAPAPRPDPPTVSYDESGMTVEWTRMPGARVPIQEPMTDTDMVLPSFPTMPVPEPTTYLVYTVEPRLSDSLTLPVALNPPQMSPVASTETGSTGSGSSGSETDATGDAASGGVQSRSASDDARNDGEPARPIRPSLPRTFVVVTTSYEQPGVPYGAERCYVVRTRTMAGGLPVVGLASPPTCVVPVDSFAPEPPSGLIAVAGAAVISLVWDPSAAADVAGYLVLRRTTSSDTLQPLTDEPIEGTAYRDDSVTPNERYVYAVQAVDNAVPANVSLTSSEVTERAR